MFETLGWIVSGFMGALWLIEYHRRRDQAELLRIVRRTSRISRMIDRGRN